MDAGQSVRTQAETTKTQFTLSPIWVSERETALNEHQTATRGGGTGGGERSRRAGIGSRPDHVTGDNTPT